MGALGARSRRISPLLPHYLGGVRVNVAVLLGADVGDMSLMEASRLAFVRSEASGGAPALLLLPDRKSSLRLPRPPLGA
jgi:hypothetical protein